MAATVFAGLTACDPLPPPPVLHVSSKAAGHDSAPGDGVCETAPGNGVCTLTAAVQEGNSLGRAEIHLPEVTQDPYLLTESTITGRITLISTHVVMQNPMATIVAPSLHIRPGGDLRLFRLLMVGAVDDDRSPHVVEGTFSIDSALVFGEFDVAPSGRLVILNGYLASDWRRPPVERATIENAGTLLAVHGAFAAPASMPIFDTQPGGRSTLLTSAVDRSGAASPAPDCTGAPAVSLGYNLTAGCGFTEVGDSERMPHDEFDVTVLADRIPEGTWGCGTNVDAAGDPRPVDFDLDGVAACDIGPHEYQPEEPG